MAPRSVKGTSNRQISLFLSFPTCSSSCSITMPGQRIAYSRLGIAARNCLKGNASDVRPGEAV